MQIRSRELFIVVATAGLLAVVFTWPLGARLGTEGRVDSGDGRYSVWNVGWVAHALTTAPSTLFDANIFYPHKHALAYSEANLVAGVMGVPAYLATGNALAANNFVTLLAFALAAVSMYLLVRHLTGSLTAAAVAGLSYGFCPYVFSHIPHMQLLMTFGIPLVLLALHRFIERPGVKAAAWLGLALALQALACGYYGIFAGLTAGVGIVWFAVFDRRWANGRYWALALLAGGLFVALVGPFVIPYVGIRAAGFGRSLDDARIFSVGWRSYLASPLLAHQWMLPLIGSWREVLFPGFMGLALSALAVVRAWWPGVDAAARRPSHRRIIGFYLLLGGLAMWTSFGPRAGLYTALFDVVPFFDMLRAPGRFGLLVTAAVAIIGGFGVVYLERMAGSGRRLVQVALVALCVLRSSPGPLDLAPMPKPTRADRFLSGMPRRPVIYFPYFIGAVDRHRQTEYMLESTYHWQPLVNGYSDYFPAEAFADAPRLATFPSEAAWQVMRDHDVRYVVVHWDKYDPSLRSPLRRQVRAQRAYLRLITEAKDVALYEVIAWPDAG